MATPTTRYARSGDIHLAYQVIGDGPRDVVLVLDWASQLEAIWEQPFIREIVNYLNRFARVLWFDMRGIGLSDRIAHEAVAAEDWVEDVFAVMDAAHSDRATLIAHGHAVQMALMSAATHPHRVDSLVLINGFARFSRADGIQRASRATPPNSCSTRSSGPGGRGRWPRCWRRPWGRGRESRTGMDGSSALRRAREPRSQR